MALLEYKCPNCGGAISFDANTQQMVCPYCNTTIDVRALQQADAPLTADQQSEAIDWQYSTKQYSPEEQQGLRAYVCNSCGGEIITDATVGATTCPFCDNPVVMQSQFSGAVRPDLVIPFKVDKAAAVAGLKRHYEGKRLLPKVFSDENHLDEVKGVYVPFWLFDAELQGHSEFRATNVRHWSDTEYDYIETETYHVERDAKMAFQAVPADGSSQMDDTLMESNEPYDYAAVVPFQTAFLAGYLANKYDVEAQQVMGRVDRRMGRTFGEAVAGTVRGYTTVSPRSNQVHALSRTVHYGLLPVWLLNTSWNGTRYVFAMNGQTGKMVGDLPLDVAAFWRWMILLFIGIAGVIAIIVFLISTFGG
jgi:DNA-directed RNA polymerase subunit RPC12/RpoP